MRAPIDWEVHPRESMDDWVNEFGRALDQRGWEMSWAEDKSREACFQLQGTDPVGLLAIAFAVLSTFGILDGAYALVRPFEDANDAKHAEDAGLRIELASAFHVRGDTDHPKATS